MHQNAEDELCLCRSEITKELRNKYLSIDNKRRIYNSIVLLYAAESRAEKSKTKGKLRRADMKALRLSCRPPI